MTKRRLIRIDIWSDGEKSLLYDAKMTDDEMTFAMGAIKEALRNHALVHKGPGEHCQAGDCIHRAVYHFCEECIKTVSF